MVAVVVVSFTFTVSRPGTSFRRSGQALDPSASGPPGKTFCSDPRHVQIDSAVVTGRRWHTRRGLRIGDSAAKLHRLYPHARRFREGWGLVQVYRHCGAGICQAEFHWVPRLTAVLRDGRVASFVFPVGAEGE